MSSSPAEDAEEGSVSVETLKKRNAILKGGVMRLQAANQALEVQRQELEAKYAVAQEELRQRSHEAKQSATHAQRLEKRCQRLAAELQEAKEAGRPSRGLLGGVFAAGPDPQLAALKEELEVAREELEQKIRENESVHIQLFEERQARDREMRDLQAQVQRLEAALQGERAKGMDLTESLRVAQSEERRLLTVVAGLRQELLTAAEVQAEEQRLQMVLRHYHTVLHAQGVVDDRRIAAYTSLSVNHYDHRRARRAHLAMEADFVTLHSIADEVLAMAEGATERLHVTLWRVADLQTGKSSPDEALVDSPPSPLTALQEELRSSNAGLAHASEALLQLCRTYLDAAAASMTRSTPAASPTTLQAKLPAAFQRWLEWVTSSLRLLVAVLSISPAHSSPDIPSEVAGPLQEVTDVLRSLPFAIGPAGDDGSCPGRPYSVAFLCPVADAWSRFHEGISQAAPTHGGTHGLALQSVDVSIRRCSLRLLRALRALCASERLPDNPSQKPTEPPLLPLPPSLELCTTEQRQAVPPHYLSPQPPYRNDSQVRDCLRLQCQQFIAASAGREFGSLAQDAAAAFPSPPPPHRSASASSGTGSGSEGVDADLQDVDWDIPCAPIDSPDPTSAMFTAPPSLPAPLDSKKTSEACCPPFDPLDPPPAAGCSGLPDAVARRVLQLYDLPDLAAAQGTVPVLAEDRDYWAEQRETFLALLRLADAKAVEFHAEYHRAVLEVEEKCQQVVDLQEALRRKGREQAALEEELASVRLSYDQQIAVLSDHLADLNARLAGSPNKRK
eukprot:GGOE01043214.1.p1 GENE.GGOE01043214.1~~GGOE01043214.1.p1  ORF type:complete len:787 (+),score=262.42 GGOE01043214.1:113-2473(+)